MGAGWLPVSVYIAVRSEGIGGIICKRGDSQLSLLNGSQLFDHSVRYAPQLSKCEFLAHLAKRSHLLVIISARNLFLKTVLIQQF